jgi:hypothetical protein
VARARLSGAEERLRLRPRAVRESRPHACISRSATRCGIARLALSPVVGIAPDGYTAGNRGFERPIPGASVFEFDVSGFNVESYKQTNKL